MAESRTVVVIGGTSGIGRAIAERFAADGATVVVAGRDGRRGEETAQACLKGGAPAARRCPSSLSESTSRHVSSPEASSSPSSSRPWAQR